MVLPEDKYSAFMLMFNISKQKNFGTLLRSAGAFGVQEVFIVEAVRTPIGRIRGGLAQVRPDDLLAEVLAAVPGRRS